LNKWNNFFTLYNEGLCAAYERSMEMVTDENQMRDSLFQEQMKHMVLNSMQAWYKKPFAQLGNQTPEQMIDEIDTIEEAIDKLKLAAALCDDDIPDYLKIKLGSFGQQAIVSLTQLALEKSWEEGCAKEECPCESIQSASIALKILGEWQVVKPVEEIIAKFISTDQLHENIADAFKMYVLGVGEETIPYLVKALIDAYKQDNPLEGAYEYLIIALTLVSEEAKSDDVFECLRNCFRTMHHKVIGAICIGDYGDPRGIPALKGYLDRNEGKFDRQEFYEILSSIKRLGGTTSDIKDPFKDFS